VSLSRAALLAHPDPTPPLALAADTSTTAMGAVLDQRVQGVWQLLAFFSRKLSQHNKNTAPMTESSWQYKRPRALGNIRGREVLPSHAGGPAFHHPDGPQTTHLCLPPEEGQVLTMPIQLARFHFAIHDRHLAYIQPGQHRHRRAFPSGGNHHASHTWRACRSPGRQWWTTDASGQ
jgi:hypothetical protein